MAHRLYKLAAWWHLLSLDAPTVAALWSWFFARAMHLHLPLIQTLMLGVGTWLLYVADRVLDGLREGAANSLRERHHFHARHRTAFLVAAALLAVSLPWFAFTRIRPAALQDDLWIGIFVIAYLYFIHRKSCVRILRLPKELAVAAIFAAATAVPAWSRLGVRKEQLIPAVAFFALLCWVNCVGIDKWEGFGVSAIGIDAHPSTRWAGLHLRLIITMIALFAIAAALLAPSRGLMVVYLAAMLSSGLLFVLDTLSARLAPLPLRIAADAALLTPLAFFPFAR